MLVNATVATLVLRRHLCRRVRARRPTASDTGRPRCRCSWSRCTWRCWPAVVLLAHHPVAFLGLFLLFLGFTRPTSATRTRSSSARRCWSASSSPGWWCSAACSSGGCSRIVSGLSPQALFFGAVGLTAITDNAALTYLGSLIAGISEEAKYTLVAGAVAGGGLTVIANAPNPAGVALLKRGFSDESIGAGGLLPGALAPTLVAMAAFLFL